MVNYSGHYGATCQLQWTLGYDMSIVKDARVLHVNCNGHWGAV